jgi:short-subunit dehydrogenase
MRIRDAVVLVTGSSSGIGAAVARMLTVRGARVVLHGRDAVRLAEMQDALDGAPSVTIDLADPGAPAELAAKAREAYGRIDAVVHSAGLGWYGDVADIPIADLQRLMQVNLRAPMELTREVLPDMLAARTGHVAFLASIAGEAAVAHESVYAASKAGLICFADSLALELAGQGVGVSVVSPGPVRTGFYARRGTPYLRRVPHVLDARRVAAVTVHGIEAGSGHAVVPRWLALAPAVRSVAPGVYRNLARRFG